MIRVGLPFPLSDDSWLGGISYFRNLVDAILAIPTREIEPVLIIESQASHKVLADFPEVEVIHNTVLSPWSVWARLGQRTYRYFNRDLVVYAVLRSHGISVLSHCRSSFGSGLPSIGWIPDFQHVHLPEFFSSTEVNRRNEIFAVTAASAERILLSSRDAQRDFCRLYPDFAGKARVLSFVAGVPDERDLPSRSTVAERYAATEPYFLVANQFWAHKNHRLIVDALHLLRAAGVAPMVLATGNTHDHRWPDHYSELMRHAEAQGVLDRFRVLGVVPRSDLLGLMRHAVALLTPSRFEGWNTGIEEAKTLGVRVIASNISVHREQAPPGALFIDPDRPNELAAAMSKLWGERDRPPSAPGVSFEVRRNSFGRAYQDIVMELVTSRKTRAGSRAT